MFFLTQLSEREPPMSTPKNDDTAMVIVESGPACDIGMPRLSAKRVGSQFFVDQPGRDEAAKKNSIVQKLILLKMSAKLFQTGSLAGGSAASGPHSLFSFLLSSSIIASNAA